MLIGGEGLVSVEKERERMADAAKKASEEAAPSTAAPPGGVTKAGADVAAAAAGKGGGAGSGPGGESVASENAPDSTGVEGAEVDPKVSSAKKSMAGKKMAASSSPYAMPEGGEHYIF